MKKIFLIGLILIGLIGAPISANAQIPKVVPKIIKNGKSIIQRVKPSKKVIKEEPRPTTRAVKVPCPSCNGERYISEWNYNSKTFVRRKCTKCNGTGKVLKGVRVR